jgi:hypothetical protein
VDGYKTATNILRKLFHASLWHKFPYGKQKNVNLTKQLYGKKVPVLLLLRANFTADFMLMKNSMKFRRNVHGKQQQIS